MVNSFSFIIPAYKEEKSIESTICSFLSFCQKNKFNYEIVLVIDDAPNDKTLEIAQQYATQHKEIVIIKNDGKSGVGNAVKQGIEKADKDVIIITVAGKHADPKDIINMAQKMNEGYDMVFGDRFTNVLRPYKYPLSKLIANRLCNMVVALLFGIRAKDITSGIKAYKSEILKNMKIKSHGFEIFIELPVMAYLMGYTNFAVLPLTHHERDIVYSHFNLMNEWPKYFKTVMRCFFFKLTRDKSKLQVNHIKIR